MSIFKRNKKKRRGLKVLTLSPSVLIRKVIYDSGCKNPEAIAEHLGLNRVSDDVMEMEVQASDERLARIMNIIPIIEAHATISAQVSAAAYAVGTQDEDDEDVDPVMLEALVLLFKAVSVSSAISCTAALMDLNLITGEYENVQ